MPTTPSNQDPALFSDSEAEKQVEINFAKRLLHYVSGLNVAEIHGLVNSGEFNNIFPALDDEATRVPPRRFEDLKPFNYQAWATRNRILESSAKKADGSLQSLFRMVSKQRRDLGIRVKGVDDVLVRLALCCHPLPGEHIVGFITRGRGVTVHTIGCPTVLESDPHRKIEVGWEESGQAPRPVKIEVTCVAQPGLLAAISSAITSTEAKIACAQVRTFSSQRAVNIFEVMIKSSEHLKEVLQNISKVKGVDKAERARGRAGGKME